MGRLWFSLQQGSVDLLELHCIVSGIRIQLKGDGETGQTSFSFGFLRLSVIANKDSAVVWLSDRLDDTGKVSIVSQQSRHFSPCEILYRLILVLPDTCECVILRPCSIYSAHALRLAYHART